MAKEFEDEVAYYYDSHSGEDDPLGEPSWHRELVHYLGNTLRQLFRGQRCTVHENLNFYCTSDLSGSPIDPDIAVIKGADVQDVRSWYIGKTGPAPQVVFEIGQEETWERDLEWCPLFYAKMGVEEYFLYDPEDPPLGGDAVHRLRGWQLDKDTAKMREMSVGPGGRLWSQQLESFLVPDGGYLRLYGRSVGQPHLTEVEAMRAKAEAEIRRAEACARRAEEEMQRAEAHARRAEEETQRARAYAQRARVLAEKLRSLGIDSDQI